MRLGRLACAGLATCLIKQTPKVAKPATFVGRHVSPHGLAGRPLQAGRDSFLNFLNFLRFFIFYFFSRMGNNFEAAPLGAEIFPNGTLTDTTYS